MIKLALKTWILNTIYNKYIQEQIETNIKQYKKELKEYTREREKERQYNLLQDTLIPAVGGNYEILKIDKPCRFSGYLDLSNFHGGDSLKVTLLFKSTDGVYKRFFEKEWDCPLVDPILTFDEKMVDGVTLSVKQSTGITGRSLLYSFRWLYI